MKIVIAGDFCPQKRVAELFDRAAYDSVLGQVKVVTNKVDYSIVNFECPVIHGKGKGIIKCGPNLYCTNKGLEAVQWAGFDCITIANNHIYDFGEDGVHTTISECAKIGVDYVGGGKNLQDASKTLFAEVGGAILAIVNCCEHEFSIATETSSGAAPLDPIKQYYQIRDAKQKADYVIVIVHGGNEHYNLPSPRMKLTYRFFVDSGADAVINHHQHCYSGYEIYEERPIFYGLGNFCFDNGEKAETKWNEGILLELEMKETISYRLYPFIQCSDEPNIKIMSPEREREFFNKLEEINEIISDDAKLHYCYEEFINNNSNLSMLFEPYTSRIGRALLRRHLVPSFVNKNKKIGILSYIQCESHIDKVLSFLRKDMC